MVENKVMDAKGDGLLLNCVNNGLTPKDIASHKKVSRQSVYKQLSRLQKKGMITKIGNIYKLTNGGLGRLTTLMGLSKRRIRLHNLGVRILVLDSSGNWDRKRNVSMGLPYFRRRVSLKNNDYDLFNFGRVVVKTTSRSVIVWLPNFFSDSVFGAVGDAMSCLWDVIPKLENRFKVSLIKDGKCNISFISQEVARVHDAIARLYRADGRKLYVKDENGKVWLVADYSFNVDELEGVDADSSDEDMSAVHNFLNDLRRNPVTFGDVLRVVSGIAENQKVFDSNMASHLRAIRSIGSGIRKLNKEVVRMNDLYVGLHSRRRGRGR